MVMVEALLVCFRFVACVLVVAADVHIPSDSVNLFTVPRVDLCFHQGQCIFRFPIENASMRSSFLKISVE